MKQSRTVWTVWQAGGLQGTGALGINAWKGVGRALFPMPASPRAARRGQCGGGQADTPDLEAPAPTPCCPPHALALGGPPPRLTYSCPALGQYRCCGEGCCRRESGQRVRPGSQAPEGPLAPRGHSQEGAPCPPAGQRGDVSNSNGGGRSHSPQGQELPRAQVGGSPVEHHGVRSRLGSALGRVGWAPADCFPESRTLITRGAALGC